MKKWLKCRGLVWALAFLMAMGAPLYVAQVPVKAAVTKAVKNGLKKENGNYYYYIKGKKVKKTWKTVKNKNYYFKSNGAAAIGWNKIGGKAYYFNPNGVMVKNKTVDKIKLNGKGQAPLNTRATMYIKFQSVLEQITKSTQTKAQKLDACYQYIYKKCSYQPVAVPNFGSGWEIKYGYNMLINKKGTCYSYASAMAMLARTCGYNADVVVGTRTVGDYNVVHAWVQIGGKIYDPQTQQYLKNNNIDMNLCGKLPSQISSQVTYSAQKTYKR